MYFSLVSVEKTYSTQLRATTGNTGMLQKIWKNAGKSKILQRTSPYRLETNLNFDHLISQRTTHIYMYTSIYRHLLHTIYNIIFYFITIYKVYNLLIEAIITLRLGRRSEYRQQNTSTGV